MNYSTGRQKRKLGFPAWTPQWLQFLIRTGFRFTIICSILAFLVGFFYYFLSTSYDLDEVAKVTQPDLIISSDNVKLATIGEDASQLVSYSEIPAHLIQALLAREDTSFRKHFGIDIKGLARATLKNLLTMSYKEGASTISMQLTKNTYENKSKSIHRKLLEIAITLRLENKYSKDEILAHYLNRIYFGSGCHGIEEAANTYFSVPTSQLTLGQSALIVGIIRGPHIFSPLNDLEAAIEQRDQVLKRMLVLGMITESQHDEAKIADLKLGKKVSQKSTGSYAVSSIQRHKQQIIDSSEINVGGLKIQSTIHQKLTSTITTDIKKLTSTINQDNPTPLQVALVVLENQTGAIRAILGGHEFNKSPNNIALDSEQELGDAFTPFLYLAALDRGRIPIKDQPVVTGRQIGYKDALTYCKRFGINLKPSENADDLYRGSIFATPLQLANAYAIIQNKGTFAESYFIESIVNYSGAEIFTQTPYKKETASKGAAINCLKMLAKDIKGKRTIQQTTLTGKHVWIIQSNSTHTAVIWIGHNLPKDIPDKSNLTKTLETKLQSWLSLLK